MSQKFKIDSRLAQDIIQSQTLKKPEFEGVSWEDLMTHIRASLGMIGFGFIGPSNEGDLRKKIQNLEQVIKELNKKPIVMGKKN